MPGRPEDRQGVPVDAVVAGDLPAEDQPDREGEQDRIHRGGAGEQEGHVHHGPEEGCEAREQTEDQPEADRELAEHDERCEPGMRVVVEQQLDECSVPVEGDRGAAGLRDGRGARPVALQRGAAIEPACAAELVIARFEPGNPTKSRTGSQNSPARELLNRNRVKAGPSISMVSPPGSLRISKSATSVRMNVAQKLIVTIWLTVP